MTDNHGDLHSSTLRADTLVRSILTRQTLLYKLSSTLSSNYFDRTQNGEREKIVTTRASAVSRLLLLLAQVRDKESEFQMQAAMALLDLSTTTAPSSDLDCMLQCCSKQRTGSQRGSLYASMSCSNQMLIQFEVVQSKRLNEPWLCNHLDLSQRLAAMVAKASFIALPCSCPLPASVLNNTRTCSQPCSHQYCQIRLMSSSATHCRTATPLDKAKRRGFARRVTFTHPAICIGNSRVQHVFTTGQAVRRKREAQSHQKLSTAGMSSDR